MNPSEDSCEPYTLSTQEMPRLYGTINRHLDSRHHTRPHYTYSWSCRAGLVYSPRQTISEERNMDVYDVIGAQIKTGEHTTQRQSGVQFATTKPPAFLLSTSDSLIAPCNRTISSAQQQQQLPDADTWRKRPRYL